MPLKLHQEELPSINLTSMIDVLFLLIIFFMVGTRFSENESSIEINLPKIANGGSMLQAPAAKVVSLKADGTIRLDGQPLGLQQLEQTLVEAARNYPSLKVAFEADGACSYQSASEVVATIKRSGCNSLDLRHAKYEMPGMRR
jgi:biopolymer transport protein ExbD